MVFSFIFPCLVARSGRLKRFFPLPPPPNPPSLPLFRLPPFLRFLWSQNGVNKVGVNRNRGGQKGEKPYCDRVPPNPPCLVNLPALAENLFFLFYLFGSLFTLFNRSRRPHPKPRTHRANTGGLTAAKKKKKKPNQKKIQAPIEFPSPKRRRLAVVFLAICQPRH